MNHKSSMIVIEVPIELLGLSNAEYISCLGLGLGLIHQSQNLSQ